MAGRMHKQIQIRRFQTTTGGSLANDLQAKGCFSDSLENMENNDSKTRKEKLQMTKVRMQNISKNITGQYSTETYQ